MFIALITLIGSDNLPRAYERLRRFFFPVLNWWFSAGSIPVASHQTDPRPSPSGDLERTLQDLKDDDEKLRRVLLLFVDRFEAMPRDSREPNDPLRAKVTDILKSDRLAPVLSE